MEWLFQTAQVIQKCDATIETVKKIIGKKDSNTWDLFGKSDFSFSRRW